MDSSSEDIDYDGSDRSEEDQANEEQNYRVCLSAASHTQMGLNSKKEGKKKRVKRVVSCKRKALHLSVSSGVRRRPSLNAKTFEAFNKGNDQVHRAETAAGGSVFHRSVSLCSRVEQESIRYGDYFSQISWDHRQMSDVLCRRRLKLNIALTLWRRNIGELLSFLIKIQDLSVLVDCLPVFTKSLHRQCAHVSIGFCVDLFPLVKRVLKSSYEDYLIIALLWVEAVLAVWWPQLSGLQTGSFSSDYKNIHAIKQQLHELWRQKHQLFCSTEATTGIWTSIESQLCRLH